MKLSETAVQKSMDHPWLVAGATALLTAVIALLAVVPTLAPGALPGLQTIQVDTDPENMLSKDEAVRVFHKDMERVFALNDMVVLGVVNEENSHGVFNAESLRRVYDLTEYALTLRGEVLGEEDPQAGVIRADVIAPSTVDNIEQAGPGVVRFEWLMPEAPVDEAAAQAVRDKARRIPFLDGTLLSESGQALCIYLPLTSKDLSYKVYTKLHDHIEGLGGDDRYFITGLPVANDTFGHEMFIQMAISAPLAMAVIFLLMLYFFRKPLIIVSPMIIALVSVIITMGLLVATGNTIHIMSSMIPIFIMPIAVLDSIHILSEFFDRYQQTRDRRKTMMAVMENLFTPMLYTSLTSAAGFASLALTPIPPVQIFGIFVALGVMLAWAFTIIFIPAFVMFIPEKRLENFGLASSAEAERKQEQSLVGRFLHWVGYFAFNHAKVVIAISVLLAVLAAAGMSQIRINDNPTKWFKQSHPIRVADRVLNEQFGGTYMAYLVLRAPGTTAVEPARAPEERPTEPETPELPAGLGASEAPSLPASLGAPAEPGLPPGLGGASPEPVAAPEPAELPTEVAEETFKEPAVLRYMQSLQEHLLTTGVVGKSNSMADIVRTVHRELIDGSEANFRIPDTSAAVAQCLMQYQSSHRPDDLWHMVTPDYQQTSIWVQLRSGDNVDMTKVTESVEAYFSTNPPPVPLQHDWFGLSYINVVWQEKMVAGMLQAFLGSFLMVLLMMIVLFRSALWGLLSMIPLTLTIALIYGFVGFIGKDYDMPVAVLSSLTLGLAVDFAIHFLARSRALYAQHGSWNACHDHVFGEPARAITKNVVVIAVGFTPLLLAPLVPYITVGVFLASILFISGGATLLLLPSLIRTFEARLFPKKPPCSLWSNFGTSFSAAVTAIALVAINIHQFMNLSWRELGYWSVGLTVLSAIICFALSRRNPCPATPN